MLTSLQARLKKAGKLLPLAFLPFAAWAQAPANDNPSGATALTLSATCTPVSTTNAGATTTTATGYTNPGCGIATAPKDVWYSFTTAATGAGSTAASIQVTGTVAGQVRAFSSTNGATGPFTQLGCSAGTTNNTQAGPLTLFGLTPSTTYYVFVSGYGSADTQGAFTICATTVPNNDAAVTTVQTLGTVSSSYGSPVTVKAVVRNVGGSTQTALPVILTVSGATTFTNTQTVATLAPGASATVTFATYPVTTAGVNTLTISVPATDDVASNNTQTYSQTVTTGTQAYVDATQPFAASAVGVGLAGGALAAKYTTSSAASITTITPTFQGAGTANTTYQLQVYSATAGVPGTLLYTSGTLTRPAVTGPVATSIPNVAVSGDFFVAVKELDNNVGLANQIEDPLRTGSFYFTTNGTTWSDVTTTTLKTRLALSVTLAPQSSCGIATGITVGSITPTSASVSFTPPAGATSYTVTYTRTGGTPVTVTPAPTASPIALTGLTAGSTYTVSITTNCAAGATSGVATATFTTPTIPPPYAILPYTQGFEGPWINGLGTSDIPDASWRNTPVTGDNSWRREDDGFTSAAWQYQANEVPTVNFPIPPYVTRFSTGAHSARFHSFGANTGTQGRLDLYVNMSALGTKTLSFDYINPTGTDQLQVLVSTDGGATFGTPVLTATTNTAFTAKTVTVASTSATTVIRFQATSDFGNDDIGIDNLRLVVLTATQNAALAATVSLYPNPAHQSFQLAIPAGSLHNATAKLTNALGQVVLVRQLSLPTAGGTAEFNVSTLAAGVYSLTLKSGNDLVVKRVVVE